MTKQLADLYKQGTLELLILRLLSSGNLNGWDVMQRLQLISGGKQHPCFRDVEQDNFKVDLCSPSSSTRIAGRGLIFGTSA